MENQVKVLALDAKRDAEQMASKALEVKMDLVRSEIVIARHDTIIWLGGIVIIGFGTVLTAMFRLMG